jgi:autotransporter translocation and assembly factor TamB
VKGRRLITLLIAAAFMGASVLAIFSPIKRALVSGLIDLVFDSRVSMRDLEITNRNAVILGFHAERRGEKVLDADRIEISYQPRDFFPGGKRRFGLVRFTIEHPSLRLTRLQDGTFNIPNLLARLRPAAQIRFSDAKPLRFTGNIKSGSVEVFDNYRLFAASHEQRIDHVDAAFDVNSAALTHYEVRADYEAGEAQPLRLIGSIDRKRGFALHHFYAHLLSIPAGVNYLTNTTAAVVLRGTAHDLEVRAYAPNLGSDGAASYHSSGTATVTDAVLHIAGLRTPIRDIRGRLDFFDDGLIIRNAQGTLTSIPLAASGGIYGLSNPSIRLYVHGVGTLERLRAAFMFSTRYPVHGKSAFAVVLEGRLSDPLALVRFSSSRLAYDRFSVHNARGLLTYYKRGIDLLPVSAAYGDIAVDARGHVDLSTGNPTLFDVEADADAQKVPYAAQIAPQAHLHGSAALFGPAWALQGCGLVDGGGAGDALFALARLDSRGVGAFAPLLVTRADRTSLAGAYYLDRPKDFGAFWINAARFRLSSAAGQSLPGIEQATPPKFSGVIDAVLGGAGSPSSFALAGSGHTHELQSGPLRLDDVAATILGSPENVRLGEVRARGSWGAFTGSGGYAANALALNGTYHGSFEQLRVFTGELGARGALASHVDLLVDRKHSVLQVRTGRMSDVTVRGVPIERLTGTLEIRGRKLRIDDADLGVAGGRVLAAGDIDGGVGVSATAVEAKLLGMPLQSGTLAAIGNFGYAGEPRFNGGVLLDHGVYAEHRVQANVEVQLRGDEAAFTHSEGLFDGTYGVADGRLLAVDTHDFGYNLALSVRGADIGTLPLSAGLSRIEGSVDADVQVLGRRSAPRFQGKVRIADGAVNGLRFQDATADIDLRPASAYAEVRAGSVVVGSTRARFSGGVVGEDVRAHVRAEKTDLADFDDFFDAGDTLGGTGKVALDFETKNGAAGIKTGADIKITEFRYRDFTLGDTEANWKTTGSTVAGQVAIGGTSGRLRVGGSIAVARSAVPAVMLAQSRYDLTTSLQGLDLGVWLPTLGYHVPLVGHVDASVLLRGRYPKLLLAGTASMNDGSVLRYPINHFTVSASSNGSRTVIDGMTLDLPLLSISGAGSFGLGLRDPLVLDAHASSTNIGGILTRAIARGHTLFGTLEADMHVDGTRARPRIAGSFDVENAGIRGVAVPRIIGALGIDRDNIIVRSMEVDFKKGRLAIAGQFPFTGSPPHIGPDKAPVNFTLSADGIDLSAFQPLLPAESKLGGELDGLLSVEGVAGSPRLRGKLALDAGALLTPFEKTPLRNIAARVTFGKSKVHLTTLHADAGSGTLDARGTITIADLMQLTADAAYGVTVDAKHAQLDFPAYGSGVFDGSIAIKHTPRELPSVDGSLTGNDAIVPFSALYRPSQAASVNPPGFDLALNIDTTAARNVRVRSSNMDIGASGNVNVGGTLSRPQLSGAFTSNSGTLTYFNRIFRVTSGTVTFERSSGIIPLMDAQAATQVYDPTSPTGTADIRLTLTGPVTNLTIGLNSDPSYERDQILALLLNEPQLGALLSGGMNAHTGGSQVVGQEAFGIVDAQFTRALLMPLETAFGQALGLSNVNVNVNYGGNVNVSARKLLGKSVNAVYASEVSYPYRQSVGFELKPNKRTSVQMTFYQALAQMALSPVNTTNIASATNQVFLSQPLTGTNGFSFTFLQYLR